MVLGAAVGLISITFGVLATSAGLSVWKAQAMSLFVFTGASQFAAIAVISSGGSAAAALGGALFLAARNGIYGMRMARVLKPGFLRRMIGAQLVIDESAGMALAQRDDDAAREAFWFTGTAVFVFWNLGTLAGAVLGEALGDPEVYGLDAAFPASMVALLVPHVTSTPGRVAALVGGGLAIAFVPLTPAGAPILLAAFAVLPALWLQLRADAP